jgi:acetyl-CoA carboxylase beta subunit
MSGSKLISEKSVRKLEKAGKSCKEGGRNTGLLKKCPECNSELKNDCFGEFQYCHVCGYWTRKETARLEPIMIFD